MTRGIVVSPHSNDVLRDWPLRHFRTLAELLMQRLGLSVTLLGTAAHRQAVAQAMAGLPAGRVENLCGGTSWEEARAIVGGARCVVANNSGIAHLAAALGVPTVCVFAAVHDPFEWMPRGPSVTTLVRRTPCSPCGIARLSECRFDHRCLRDIAPETVFDAVAARLG